VRTVSSSEMSSSSTALLDTAMGSGVVVSVGGGLLLEGRVASTSIDVGIECLVSMSQLGGSCKLRSSRRRASGFPPPPRSPRGLGGVDIMDEQKATSGLIRKLNRNELLVARCTLARTEGGCY
jgi:hypothetical protein